MRTNLNTNIAQIGHHLIHPSPLPFTKAILESGSPTARSVLSPKHTRSLAQHASLQKYASHFSRSRFRQDRSLQALPIDIVLQASLGVFSEHTSSSTWPFQPVTDGKGGMIPNIPLHQLRSLCQQDVVRNMSIITGFCSHEGTQFVPLDISTNSQFRTWFATLIPSFTENDLNLLEALYPDPVTSSSARYKLPPGSENGLQWRRLHEAYAHYAYICPILHTAHTLSKAGARVHLYEYAAISESFNAASHGDQARIVAHDMGFLNGKQGLLSVAEEMTSRWGEFIASPTGEASNWPRFRSPFEEGGETRGELLVFGKGNNEAGGGEEGGVAVQKRVLTEEELAQCRFWWERMELSQGMGVRGQLV